MTKQDVLQQCTVEGFVVKLPAEQLDRALYQEVAKALTLIGGKWKGGKIYGFVFDTDPTDLLAQIAGGTTRNLKKEYQFFATPAAIAKQLVALADIKPNDVVLEPSAGQGAIIREINAAHAGVCDCYELMEVNRIILNKSGLRFNFIGNDFFEAKRLNYTKIIANPPFTNNQDIDHVREMYRILAPGGTLVSIMSQSWTMGNTKKQQEFREWFSSVNSEMITIPAGAFKESGTNVGAVIVSIYK